MPSLAREPSNGPVRGGETDGKALVPDDCGRQSCGHERSVVACAGYEVSVRAAVWAGRRHHR